MIINFSNLGGGGGGEYILPTATASRLGGVKIGEGIDVAADGTISVTGGTGSTGIAYITTGSTFADVTSILGNNELPILVDGGHYYIYTEHYTSEPESYIFNTKDYGEYKSIAQYLYSNDTWHKVNLEFQKKLTAGQNITISNNVISAAGVDPEEYLEAQEVISEALNDLNTRMGDVNNALNLI